MSSHIFVEGMKYVSTAEAADLTGLTRDYIVRLCRGGELQGRMVGSVWYVGERSLDNFLLSHLYTKERRRTELRKDRRHSYQKGSSMPRELREVPVLLGPHNGFRPPLGATPASHILHKIGTLSAALALTIVLYGFVDYRFPVFRNYVRQIGLATETSSQLASAAGNAGTLGDVASNIWLTFDDRVYSFMNSMSLHSNLYRIVGRGQGLSNEEQGTVNATLSAYQPSTTTDSH